ncbi:MAG: hypothetical protein KBT04_02575, partial [Bacteroidales bacterium]|nr:hypothetical protein [Candidatus Colimorpha onthohippi]
HCTVADGKTTGDTLLYSAVHDTHLDFADLKPGQMYHIYMRANCSDDPEQPYSQWRHVQIETHPLCFPVENMEATVDGTHATVTWTKGLASQGDDYAYRLLEEPAFADTMTLAANDWLAVGDNTSVCAKGEVSAPRIDFADLKPERTYFLYVGAKCGSNVGSRFREIIFTMPPACKAPRELKATNVEPTSLTLKWKDEANLQQFRIGYFYGSTVDSQVAVHTILVNRADLNPQVDPDDPSLTQLTYDMSGLRSDTTYHFTVYSLCPNMGTHATLPSASVQVHTLDTVAEFQSYKIRYGGRDYEGVINKETRTIDIFTNDFNVTALTKNQAIYTVRPTTHNVQLMRRGSITYEPPVSMPKDTNIDLRGGTLTYNVIPECERYAKTWTVNIVNPTVAGCCQYAGYSDELWNIAPEQTSAWGDYVYRDSINRRSGTHDSLIVLNLAVRKAHAVNIVSSSHFGSTAAGSITVCKGDTVTLMANVIDSSFLVDTLAIRDNAAMQHYNIGDILCTNDSILSPEAFVASGLTAKGVVYMVSAYSAASAAPDSVIRVHAVSLPGTGTTDGTTDGGWYDGTSDGSIVANTTNYTSAYMAVSDTSGYANTAAIRAAGSAYLYPAAHSVDFAAGWYLPAAGELHSLMQNIDKVNASLAFVGHPVLYSTSHAWSSTIYSRANAWRVAARHPQSNTAMTFGIASKNFRSSIMPVCVVQKPVNHAITSISHASIGSVVDDGHGSKGVVFGYKGEKLLAVATTEYCTNCNWHTDLSADWKNRGWRKPTADELTMLYANSSRVDDSLAAMGGTPLTNSVYHTITKIWSANEQNGYGIYRDFGTNVSSTSQQLTIDKNSGSGYVQRAVREFRFGEPRIVSTIGSYAWSDGSNKQSTTYVANDDAQTVSVMATSNDLSACVSNASVVVNVCHTAETTLNVAACDFYHFGGKDYDQSGTYHDTIASAAGCDSVITLNLTVNSIARGEEHRTVPVDELPYEYTVDGVTYSFSTDTSYVRTYSAASLGTPCDSLVNVTLSVYPDNLRVINCPTDPFVTEWDIDTLCVSGRTVAPQVQPLVGDLDGDGQAEIVCWSGTDMEVTSGENYHKQTQGVKTLMIYKVVDSALQLQRSFTITGVADANGSTPYGLVRLADGTPIIVVAKRQSFDYIKGFTQATLLAYRPDGSLLWESDCYADDQSTLSVGKNAQSTLGFADFNGDGNPEVYIRDRVFDAATGRLLLDISKLTDNNAANPMVGASWAYSTNYYTGFSLEQQYNGFISVPMAADVLGTGHPQLLLGANVYDVRINNRNGVLGNTATLAKHAAIATASAYDGHAQVADFNFDGNLDMLVTTRSAYNNSTKLYAYIWDVKNDSYNTLLELDVNGSGMSMPAIADVNNDGKLEVMLQAKTALYGTNSLLAYTVDPVTLNFNALWQAATTDGSYSNCATVFDFNQDSIYEVLTAGDSKLQILNGENGAVVASFDLREPTTMTYPIVADVNADGFAEIVVADSLSGIADLQRGKLRVFYSPTGSWASTRPVWNQFMYNATNVNNDLSVPANMVSNAAKIAGPELTPVVRQPYNAFLAQVPLYDQYGRMFKYAPNVEINQITDADTTFVGDSIYVTVSYCNVGDSVLPAPYYVTSYHDSVSVSSIVLVDTVNTPLQVAACDTVVMAFYVGNMCDVRPLTNNADTNETCVLPRPTFANDFNLIFSVNDHGDGVAQTGTNNVSECDTTNNQDTVRVNISHYTNTGTEDVFFCASYSEYVWHDCKHYDREVLLAAGTFYDKDTLPNHWGCDSIISLSITVIRADYADTDYVVACDSLAWTIRVNMPDGSVESRDTVFRTDT